MTVASALGGEMVEHLDAYDHWFLAEFDELESDAGASLVLEGLATLADVWLNGTHVLSSDNMFVSHEVPVERPLASGNELAIRFASVDAWLSERVVKAKSGVIRSMARQARALLDRVICRTRQRLGVKGAELRKVVIDPGQSQCVPTHGVVGGGQGNPEILFELGAGRHQSHRGT